MRNRQTIIVFMLVAILISLLSFVLVEYRSQENARKQRLIEIHQDSIKKAKQAEMETLPTKGTFIPS